jgi:multidrug efflux pump subunit AcrA (membrane-fusion protein)
MPPRPWPTSPSPVIFNALRYESLPTLPFARGSDFLVRKPLFRSRAIWAALAAACILPVLAFWPADFFVHARGKLQPQIRRETFAPLDGQVTRLSVRHGDRVQAGAPLLELSNPQLDVETQRLQGEYDTTRKRLAVIESSLLQVGAAKERSRERIEELSAEQEELVKLADSQRTQLALLAKERDKLVVRSPMEGEVLTWEVEQLLKDRPVERGQSLLSIGDLTGPWLAEVLVPDNSISYLLDRRAVADEPLSASFQLATDRHNQYQGTVRTISSRTETDRDEQAVVKVVVDFDAQAVRELRPGATIFARIHCGRRPLGYVWFHELIEAMRGWKFYWSA